MTDVYKDVFKCPFCNMDLINVADRLTCNNCSLTYRIVDDIPILLIEEAEDLYGRKNIEYTITKHKLEVKSGYTNIAKSIEGSAVNDSVYFLNLGYAPDQNVQYAKFEVPIDAVNKNSVKLIFETIGSVDFNRKDFLEVGCGRGGNIKTIHQFYRTNKTVGVDLCTANVKFSRSYNVDKNTYFAVADAEKLPFKNNEFDIIVNIESSSAYTNIHSFYNGVYRILRQGGYFLYADVLEEDTFDNNIGYLTDLGFRIIRYSDITSNVLLSCYQEYRKKILAYKDINKLGDKEDLEDFIGMPGSKIYNNMKTGYKSYRIYNLIKDGE